MLSTAHHLSLSSARCIQTQPSCPVCLRSIFILPYHLWRFKVISFLQVSPPNLYFHQYSLLLNKPYTHHCIRQDKEAFMWVYWSRKYTCKVKSTQYWNLSTKFFISATAWSDVLWHSCFFTHKLFLAIPPPFISGHATHPNNCLSHVQDLSFQQPVNIFYTSNATSRSFCLLNYFQ
jgi:hypothetical protein